ncbi:hypothetical protein C8Q80DRAFT_1267892 [Daedaleopsis nitida]|nr:hypothetical protein C8Q80DRAFT_1267892 [Daedaleopsis nitida]
MIDLYSIFRGKATKADANQRYYQTHKRAAASIPSLLDAELPAKLHARGTKLFHAAFTAYSSVPTLGLWTPPYRYDAPPYEAMERYHEHENNSDSDEETSEDPGSELWCSDAAILGSLQCERVLDAGQCRAELWQSAPIATIRAELRTELSARIDNWVELKGYPQTGTDWEAVSREVALDWGAKIIVLLVEEWELLVREGLDFHRQAYDTERLPWQDMMRSMKLLLKQETCM